MTNAEIQVGEYVRTKNGSIFKIIAGNYDDYLIDVDYHDLQKIEDDIYDELMWLNYNDNGNFIRQICKKHDFDIIKLIEVGDYVNGYRVTCGHYTFNNEIEMIELDTENAGSGYGYQLPSKDIKTIVTKEQFNKVKYEVSGEDE